MQRKTRAAGVFVSALALAAAAACSDDAKGGGDAATEGAEAEFEAPRLIDMVNESNRLLHELESAEARIVQDCLEDQGLTVHDQVFFPSGEFEEQTELFGADDWGNWLPPLEEASQYGLGVWRWEDEADPDEVEAYEEFKGYESFEAGLPETSGDSGFDNSEFGALDPQDQYAWYVAYQGEAAAREDYGYLIGEESDEAAASDDEIYTGDEFSYVQPEPGGCQREMIDALYDDLRLVEDPEGGKIRGAYWYYRPDNPMDDTETLQASQVMFREALVGVQGELVDCLTEHGRHGWEFDEEGSLPVTDYLYELYEGSSDTNDHPDLPEDAPSSYEDKKAFEIAFAVDLAECGDETGYRETAAQAWAESQESFYVSIETEVYVWQEEVQGILTKAQEVLES